MTIQHQPDKDTMAIGRTHNTEFLGMEHGHLADEESTVS
jgi:hypothetical protein